MGVTYISQIIGNRRNFLSGVMESGNGNKSNQSHWGDLEGECTKDNTGSQGKAWCKEILQKSTRMTPARTPSIGEDK